MDSTKIELLDVDEAAGCARCGALVVFVWRGAPTRERMSRCVAAFDVAAQRCGCAPAVLGFLEEGSPPPSPLDLMWAARAHDARPIAATAAVLDGRDPWFSSVFDRVLQMLTLRRSASTTKVCADLSEAAAWLSTRIAHGSAPDAFRREVSETVEAVREAMDAVRVRRGPSPESTGARR